MTIDVSLPDRYRVRRVLGIGGMATVYLADDLVANREVAVKVLKSVLVGAVATDRFLREIRVVGGLQHGNIVPLLDAGEWNGVPYYVMPCVDGESLRARLQREGPLPLEEAARIMRVLANALEAAHRDGIVHRDVKPENVLLARDHVFLADFGIARALSHAADDRLTDSGIAIGTPCYMTPEQAAGERDVDLRSDIYSLGCLTYEMLAGETPYTGPSSQAVVAKQLSLPVPSLLVIRDTIPEAVDDVVRKALAKVPADRYQTAAAFADAFDVASRTRTGALGRVARRARKNAGRLGAGFVAVAAAAVFLARGGFEQLGSGRDRPQASDTLRYAVFPFAHRGVDASVAAEGERTVRNALLRWTGITVIDDGRIRDAIGTRDGASLTTAAASTLAHTLRSGRYLRGEIVGTGNATELRLRLFDGFIGDSLIAEAIARVAPGATPVDSLIAVVVDSVLLRELQQGKSGMYGTRSLPARQAYGQGRRALYAWDLARADSAFGTASRVDPSFVEAQLWLAVSRLWAGVEPTRWSIAAEQAAAGEGRLSDPERTMAQAVQAQSRGEMQRACPLWRRLTERDSLDAIAWYGSAYCQTSDNIVLADRASPSGWRFRTSYHRALQDYERAFRLQPTMLASLGTDVFEALGRLFKAGPTLLRAGHALPPSGQRFTSSMEWTHDSLAFVPYPWGSTGAVHVFRRPGAINEAVRHQRVLVRNVASSWVSAFPKSSDAWQALAMSLAALGESSALDTLARARSLAKTREERIRVAGADAAMQLGFALRDGDTVRLRAVRALADSVLDDRQSVGDGDAVLRTSLAALTGRADLAMRYSRSPAVADALAVPEPLRDGAPALLVLSALGGPGDSLRVLERRVADLIARGVSPSEQKGRRLEFLARGASMAFPLHRSEMLGQLAADGDPLVALQVRLLNGDSAGVRRGLAGFKRDRRSVLPEHLAIDALAPEAAMLWSLGDADAVVEWLAPTFDVLPQAQPGLLSSPVRAGSLVPALLLRARAASRLGDANTAHRSAAAVVILWSDADPFLQPLAQEAGRLTR